MTENEFKQLTRWVEDLSPHEREGLAALRAKMQPGLRGRLLPEDHGADMMNQLQAAKTQFLAQKDPFCLVRVSDCELSLLGSGFLPSDRIGNRAWHYRIAGYDRSSIALRNQFIAAIEGAELVGLQQNWLPVTEDTEIILSMMGFPLPLPNGVEVHLPYTLLVDGTLLSYLAGKRVLLVGHLAPALDQMWKQPSFVAANSRFGPIDRIEIKNAIRTRSRGAGGACLDLPGLVNIVDALDFDVALLGCGLAGKVLAWHIRKRGRTALDVGFVFDALMGSPEAKMRPVFRDVPWV